MHRRSAALTLLMATVLVAWTIPAEAGTRLRTTLVSVRPNGTSADDDSLDATISDSGRLVAYESDADNLSNQDDNDFLNVFLHDRRTGRNRVVSVRSNGGAASSFSAEPEISGNGRFVCFESLAANLSNQDDNDVVDIFVHDLRTRRTRVVSLSSGGDAADDHSEDCSISDRGRYVAFESDATNLSGVDGSFSDIFVHDRETGRTRLVSVASNGDPGDDESSEPAIAGNGRRIAFDSDATNLSAVDGNFRDIFVHDRRTGGTRLVSVASNGDPANDTSFDPAMSNDRLVAFESDADNLAGNDDNNDLDIFVHDLGTGRTRLASKRTDGVISDGFSSNPGLSGNGRFVVFRSDAANLSNRDDDLFGDDIFVHNRRTGRTRLVSLRSDGGAADSSASNTEPSGHRTISESGAWIVFHSHADNLSNQDDNDFENVFVRGPLA
jgi:Tol biopolymer transport system component